ncbi:hypothetical protein DFR30_1426 [Thiogranum longum]|uniref:Uncharacterized protein n=1 Tax=Thiogranum longum TaxID=1537524 RepID=A0A4R1HA13_9GAMM|nr:hypothetical protein [Thiogranum longum]TCK18158.1 hypothetical protein DFR30_1426 [Thiogranum longum]
MNNSSHLTGLRHTLFSGILIVCNFITPAAFAENSPSAGNTAGATPEIDETVQSPLVVVPLGEEDAVIMQDEISWNNPIISAGFSPSDLKSGQHKIIDESSQGTSRHTESDFTVVTAQHEFRQVPHSVLLALIALIVLIPVSRRTH